MDHIASYVELTEEDVSLISQIIPVRHFAKGEYLLKAGQISDAFFFMISGFVRLFYLQEGEEKTTYFYPEGTFVSAYSSFMRQQPASFYFQSTEDTEVAVIGLEASQQLLAHSSKFETLARIAMEEEMISLQEIIASLLTLSPEERYAELLEKNPGIFQKVPQAQIASFIGVKPESLSRIKKRFMERS
jgi:CRP-like cAMP-binding protein